ncbi:HEXXH motif domain-containing protein [Cystobacter fuscus]|uniref:HEXXH motif domain-containing protein n=1 Tax=Cystobacter fuscus TaxID=43 RepID=A0A250J6T4_9BACT|nr:HEXXH motif-containing putative peptide modification protein [Cystobacter fuscus]ATB39202.1 HEXXH motif domain-containing protein [Cystobacter fuscus]
MVFSVFSNPHEGAFLPLAENLSCRMFRGLVAHANSHAEQLGAARVDLGNDAITPRRLSVGGWMPEIGAASMGIGRGVTKDSWSWISGQLMLAAFLSQLIPSLELEFTGPHPVTVAGHFLRDERLLFRGDSQQLLVKNGAGQTVLALEKLQVPGMAPAWLKSQGNSVRLGNAAVALLGNDEWMSYWLPEGHRGVLSADSRGDTARLESAMAIMEECIPEYFLWVTTVLRELVLIEAHEHGTQNQSFGLYPGHVHGSAATVLTALIMLIHECSHQFLNLLFWHGRLAKPSAPAGYSILKKTKRPLDRVLVGFHAVGNVLLGLMPLQSFAGRVDREELEKQLRTHESWAVALDEPLRQHGAEHLEEMGKEIYYPLRKRLVDANLLPPA